MECEKALNNKNHHKCKYILKHLKELSTKIWTLPKNYTTTHLIVTKNNMKKTWKTINDTLGRGRNQSKLPNILWIMKKDDPY